MILPFFPSVSQKIFFECPLYARHVLNTEEEDSWILRPSTLGGEVGRWERVHSKIR